ncbi:MAG: NAD(P)H-hydrate dehydratase [Muribaculaceae bacterium]|nr:NAD(P)H-hydrate dehydratase [Muribaculaceae bacterium]
MKIFTSELIREIDKATCEAQGITSLELMERAAAALCWEIESRFNTNQRMVIFAGPGNNGGDALAVARMLFEQGYKDIEVFLFNVMGKLSHDCNEEKNKISETEGINFTEVTKDFQPPEISEKDVVIDGLFGSGFKGPLQKGFLTLVNYINDSKAYVISIDVPTGLSGEWNQNVSRRDMIHANLTLTFQFPRLSFFFEENQEVLGEWKLLDIELDESKMKDIPVDFMLVEERNVRPLFKKRNEFTGKRDYGSALLFAGSVGMSGAAVLAAKGCLRTGVGLVTVHSAKVSLSILQTTVPEALFEPDRNEHFITDMSVHHNHQAIAVGPGLGVNEKTIDALENLLKNYKNPIVIDADALNCMARRPHMLSLLPAHSVITPHIGEFDRLFGDHSNNEERLKKAIDMAKYYNIVIVLKGHYTATVRPTGRVFFNSNGNPGMATAGSGDVLTGVITSFIAQGFHPDQAATLGVFVHGMAGDLAEEKWGEYGMLSSEIADCCAIALKNITSRKK